jgi:hypothetical protein
MNDLLTIKKKIIKHILEKTIANETSGDINYAGRNKPYVIIQWLGTTTTRDICNTKDITKELGVRCVAASEDTLYQLIEEISLMYNSTAVGSVFKDLYTNGVMAVRHKTEHPSFQYKDNEECSTDLIFELDIRQTYRNV